MLETNYCESNLKQSLLLNGNQMTPYLLMSSRPQVERPRSKTNQISKRPERESLRKNSLQNQSILIASNQVNQNQDEGKCSSINYQKIDSNSVLFENESNLKRKKYAQNRLNSLRESSRKLSQSPLKEFNDEAGNGLNQKGDGPPIYQVLGDIRKQNLADFKNIFENKVANKKYERRLSGLMNPSPYQSRQKGSEKKLTEQSSQPPSLEMSFYINPRPPTKASPSPKKARFQPPLRSTTLDLDFDLNSTIIRRRANTDLVSPEKDPSLVLNPGNTFEPIQNKDPSSKDGNLQNLKTFESLQIMPDLNNISPSKPQQRSPQKCFSPQKRRPVEKCLRLNQSCVQEDSKSGDTRSFLVRKDLNKSPMNLTDSLLISPTKNGSPKKRFSSKIERDLDLQKNRDLINEEKVKEKQRLLEKDKKFNSLLDSQLDSSFGKIDQTLARYQELRTKNDTYIASIRKHY